MSEDNQVPRPLHKKVWIRLRSCFQWILGGALFTANVAILFVLSFFKTQKQLDSFLQCLAAQMIWVSGIKIQHEGLEHLDRTKNYMVVFNHINFFDHFVMFRTLKLSKLRGIEKESHFSWPVYGTFLRRIRILPIAPRGDTKRALESLEKAKIYIKQEYSLLMAPEGTRSKDGKLQPFKKGAFHLAIETGVTILPVVFKGMDRFNLKGSIDLHPGPVTLSILPTIEAKKFSKDEVGELRDLTHQVIKNALS
ncbi:MAG: 1-acyl-sn-glycerol-3-phosphate acyltransferase [Bdellovibrionales bacterium]|nr:1-acyl-sn-glycerol-3-phosphate acyltransferase [Bdellovibrionales bacterium]